MKQAIPLQKLVWLYFVELINPSEGKYIPVAPSGNCVYIGPSLKTRVERRISGYYRKQEPKQRSIDYLV